MAVTTTYALNFVKVLDLPTGPAQANADMTSLANGGFAAAGDIGSNHSLDFFDADGNHAGVGAASAIGTFSSVVQLANGDIYMGSEDSTSVWRSQLSGGLFVQSKILDPDSSKADVAALTGGSAWVVYEDFQGGSNYDIKVLRDPANGQPAQGFTIDSSLSEDHGASAAGLDDGNVAIAWTRTAGSETEVWYAVYDPAGVAVKAPLLLDTAGSINRSVSVAAKSQGFVIAYQDNGWNSGTSDITLARFTLNGAFERWDNVSNPNSVNDFSHDTNPYVARMPNNDVIVAYSYNEFPIITYTKFHLIDPADGSILASRNFASPFDDAEFPALAGFGNGGVAVFHTNVTESDIEGAHFQAVRTSLGDSARNVIAGDSLVDVMRGGRNNDTLRGFAGDDRLAGESENDTLDGGTGRDVMSGGSGSDRFVFASIGDSGTTPATRDRITDFKHRIDKIDLTAIDAKTGTGGKDTFVFIGTLAFNAEGQVRVVQSGLNTIVQVNTTGTTGAEMSIRLDNVTASALTLVDFFF